MKVSLITACHNGAGARKTAMKLLAGVVVALAGEAGGWEYGERGVGEG